MIVSQKIFNDVVERLDMAAQEALELTRVFVRWIENDPVNSEAHDLISVLDHLIGINASLAALEQLLRIILETNQQRHGRPRT